eukprot:8612064-Pyramimonas_sp.AAC.1
MVQLKSRRSAKQSHYAGGFGGPSGLRTESWDQPFPAHRRWPLLQHTTALSENSPAITCNEQHQGLSVSTLTNHKETNECNSLQRTQKVHINLYGW